MMEEAGDAWGFTSRKHATPKNVPTLLLLLYSRQRPLVHARLCPSFGRVITRVLVFTAGVIPALTTLSSFCSTIPDVPSFLLPFSLYDAASLPQVVVAHHREPNPTGHLLCFVCRQYIPPALVFGTCHPLYPLLHSFLQPLRSSPSEQCVGSPSRGGIEPPRFFFVLPYCYTRDTSQRGKARKEERMKDRPRTCML